MPKVFVLHRLRVSDHNYLLVKTCYPNAGLQVSRFEAVSNPMRIISSVHLFIGFHVYSHPYQRANDAYLVRSLTLACELNPELGIRSSQMYHPITIY